MIKKIVRDAFEKTVMAAEIHDDLKRALMTKQQGTDFCNQMYNELSKANVALYRRRGKAAKKETIESTVADFAKIWIKGLAMEADRRMMSDIEKYKQAHANDDIKDMEATLEGNTQGAAFEELGLEIVTDREDAQDAINEGL